MELVSDALDMSDKECLLLPFSNICEKIRENMNDMIDTKQSKGEKEKMVELRIQVRHSYVILEMGFAFINNKKSLISFTN